MPRPLRNHMLPLRQGRRVPRHVHPAAPVPWASGSPTRRRRVSPGIARHNAGYGPGNALVTAKIQSYPRKARTPRSTVIAERKTYYATPPRPGAVATPTTFPPSTVGGATIYSFRKRNITSVVAPWFPLNSKPAVPEMGLACATCLRPEPNRILHVGSTMIFLDSPQGPNGMFHGQALVLYTEDQLQEHIEKVHHGVTGEECKIRTAVRQRWIS